MSRVQILSIGIDKVTMEEAVDRCLEFTRGDRPRLVVTPNAEITYMASYNAELTAVLNRADLAIPDGAGILLAARVLGDPVPEKVAGVELSTRLLEALSREGRGRIYLLGAKPEVVAEAARRIKERFPGLESIGYHHGYFTAAEEPALIESIREAHVDALFVGMGVPRQEFWLGQHLAELNAKVSFGVGGTLDIWAGIAPRAPKWMVKANLEWLFRIVKFGRYGRSLPPLVKFVLMVIHRRMRGE